MMNSGNRNSGYCNSGDCNSGNSNSGHFNSGHFNSGDCNSGDCNSGNRNSGYCNSGDCNSGNCNSGNSNSGNSNSGHFNSGHCNSGHFNSGHFNSGDCNSGYFCTGTPKPTFFDVPWDGSWEEASAMIPYMELPVGCEWIKSDCMSDDEKQKNPNYETIGGYLKKHDLPFKEAFQSAWAKADQEKRNQFLSLPNFNADKFFEITGVRVGTNTGTVLNADAPELLEKLKHLVRWHDQLTADDIAAARAVIAKVERNLDAAHT